MSQAEPSGKAETPGAELCLACGLCCRGVWFTEVKLDDAEAEKAGQMGLKLEQKDGGQCFVQPCPKHDGKGCSIYGTWRPTPCVQYRCALLEQLESGSLPLPEALERVTVARAMADRLVDTIGAWPEGLLGQAFADAIGKTPSGQFGLSAKDWQEAKMDAVTLRVLYEKHFKA